MRGRPLFTIVEHGAWPIKAGCSPPGKRSLLYLYIEACASSLGKAGKNGPRNAAQSVQNPTLLRRFQGPPTARHTLTTFTSPTFCAPRDFKRGPGAWSAPFLGLGSAIFSFSIALVDKLLTLTKQFTQAKSLKTQDDCGLLGIFTCFLCSVLAFLAPAPPRSHDGRVTICNLAAPQHPSRQPAALLPCRRTAAGGPHGCTISTDSGKP